MLRKIFRITFKTIGVLLLLVLAVAGYFYYIGTYYETYSLKVDKANFPNVVTKIQIDSLAEALVSHMTLEEKIDQMYGETPVKGWNKLIVNSQIHNIFPHIYVGRNERLGIPPFVLSDGPRGARVISKDTEGVTTFPVAMARGASWDVDLEHRINEVIAIEMRANGANYAATPCMNILRNPKWGRAQETYGEDPWHMGEMAVAATQGIQTHHVMACPKHYALNSIENSRTVINVEVEERALREVYLPHFKKVLQEGKAASIMSAYNKVNGEYLSDNDYLLTDILRKEWGFEGFVTSDWILGTHDATESIRAGMDIEMPFQNIYAYDKVKSALENGEITEPDIDKIVLRILKTRLPYAFAKDSMRYSEGLLAQEKHTRVALEAAEKSMVLLKNDGVLPFSKTTGKKIAVIGGLANSENTGDHGSSDSRPTYVVTPLEGIRAYQKALGNEVIYNDGIDIATAVSDAVQADEVVLVVGYDADDEGEYILADINSQQLMEQSAKAGKLVGKKGIGGDRESLRLSKNDEALIKKVAASNKNSVVVYVGGSAIDMSAWHNQVNAILFAWYGGMEGGNALANILYGNTSPSGKLPFSIAKNEDDYPYFTPYATDITYYYYHGYTLFEKKNKPVAYPFGHGLSYTTFSYDSLQVLTPEISINDELSFSVRVTNSGAVDGEEVVQLYIGFSNSAIDRPIKLLRGFKKVALEAGEEQTVSFKLNAKDLAFYNPETKNWEIEQMDYEVYIGGSSDERRLLKSTFKCVAGSQNKY
ncbi:glycoside hydrolase family 3 C-terminal domain-containing protein [Maribacter sp. 2307ULW6-5]|uniref:glycoside hydrolase family 3 C-terminal domain-containing protein n=1 Tax=Maribacter sp. 2307ULW6-5 TaxID=3386275 RepID=UPI0039BD3F5D